VRSEPKIGDVDVAAHASAGPHTGKVAVSGYGTLVLGLVLDWLLPSFIVQNVFGFWAH
jgi:hypothetical protein